ncbi:MAG: VanZ family protein, partial [Oscillospiraceae bacterium]|nr:VanZ family protein [Oscillospiraceae bacterium]
GPDFFTFHTDEDGDGEPDRTSLLVRKLAHITEFACLGALLRLLTDEREGAAALSALYAAGAAVSDEALQLLSHRGAQLRDVLLDCAGAARTAGERFRKRRKPAGLTISAIRI